MLVEGEENDRLHAQLTTLTAERDDYLQKMSHYQHMEQEHSALLLQVRDMSEQLAVGSTRQEQLQKLSAIIDQQNGTNVSEAAGAAAQAAGSTGGGSGSSNVTRSTTNSLGAAVGEGNNSLSTQAAKRAMNANNPNKE